jgi:hypothetical protein
MNVYFQKILEEVKAEREYQNRLWGTDFDNLNDLDNWARYIMTYCARAVDTRATPANQRRDMMKVAAIAVAACEAFDRNGHFPPRRYEE